MKAFIVFSVLVFLFPIFVVQFIQNIPSSTKVPLETDPTLYAGEGEACETAISRIECQEGLECVVITEKPHRNAVCLPPGTDLGEDFTYKYDFDITE